MFSLAIRGDRSRGWSGQRDAGPTNRSAPYLPPEGVCAPLHTTDRPGTLPRELTTTSYRNTAIRSSLTGWIGRFALGRKHSQAVSQSRPSYGPLAGG